MHKGVRHHCALKDKQIKRTDQTSARFLVQILHRQSRSHTHFIKMLWSDIDRTAEPSDCPAVEVEAGKHILVAQWGKELILRDERLAVEDAALTIVEGQF